MLALHAATPLRSLGDDRTVCGGDHLIGAVDLYHAILVTVGGGDGVAVLDGSPAGSVKLGKVIGGGGRGRRLCLDVELRASVDAGGRQSDNAVTNSNSTSGGGNASQRTDGSKQRQQRRCRQDTR